MTGVIAFAGHLGLRSTDAPLLAHTGRSSQPLDQSQVLADNGFAGVQDIFLKSRPIDEQCAMAEKMAALGLAMGTFNGDPLHWNKPLWSSRDVTARSVLFANLTESIAITQRMGGGAAVCVCGHDPGRSNEDQLAGFVDNLREMGETAAKEGLCLLVEPVASAWIPGLLLSRLHEAASVVRAVDLPSVRLLFDTGHVAMAGDDVLSGLQEHWDIIGTIQISDSPGRIDVGAGTLDWTSIFEWITTHGYAGLVEVEHEPLERSAAGEIKLIDRLRSLAPKGSFTPR